MRAIDNDAPIETTTGSLDEGMEGFLDLWRKDADDAQPSEDDGQEDSEDTEDESIEDTDTPEGSEDDEDETEGDEDTDEDDDESDEDDSEGDDDDKPRKVLKDDAVVKVKVDGEELAVPVEKLKRLYGQEAALTRKSQEVAETRKTLETRSTAVVAANEALLTRAKERFAQYAEIDWLVAAQELNAEELKVLRGEAKKAYDDVQFFESELGSFIEKAQAARHSELVAEAKETFKTLSDPKTGIKGFNEALYNDMRTFAIGQGVPTEFVDNLVSAPVLRLLHNAMLYERGQKVITKTSDKRAKKIVKSKSNPEATREAFKPKGKTKAMDRLRERGDLDSAADAFLAGWSDE